MTDEPAVFAVDVDEFRAQPDEQHVPLLGTNGDTIIPAGGLVVVAGQPGVGKTTLLLDLVWHFASGADWLGLAVPRPLNVLVIENEGPEHMFRAKLDRKAGAWNGSRVGRIWIQTWRWGLFSLVDNESRARLSAFAAEHPVDVIVGDPLGSLGPAGVGSPDETRRFVVNLLELGLPTAFAFVHHFRKEPTSSEVDQLSGAWAGHLDSLLLLKPTRRRNQLRLSFPKTRWAEAQHKPMILGYLAGTQGFELLGEEGDEVLLERTLVDVLSDGTLRTPTELKEAGARRETIEAVLEANPHLFQKTAGQAAGRPRAKVVWGLVPEVAQGGFPAGQAGGATAAQAHAQEVPEGDALSLALSPPPFREGWGGQAGIPDGDLDDEGF